MAVSLYFRNPIPTVEPGRGRLPGDAGGTLRSAADPPAICARYFARLNWCRSSAMSHMDVFVAVDHRRAYVKTDRRKIMGLPSPMECPEIYDDMDSRPGCSY